MNPTWKLSNPKQMKFIYYVSLTIFLSFLMGNHPVLDSMSARLHTSQGVLMSLEIHQDQYGNEWIETANFEIVNERQFIFQSPHQIFKVDGQVIYTFNPESKQVVVDQVLSDEFSIIDLLRGDFEEITVKKIENNSDSILLEFTINEMNISGSIMIQTESFIPEQLVLYYDENNQINVMINSYNELSPNKIYDEFNISDWEVIDLRN
jgi:outer membrane lipoprotein-sorting protein